MPPELLNDGLLSKVNTLHIIDCATFRTSVCKLPFGPMILTVLFILQAADVYAFGESRPYHVLQTP